MTTTLTETVWLRTLNFYAHGHDITVATMAQMLIDLIEETDDPRVTAILNRHAAQLLEKP